MTGHHLFASTGHHHKITGRHLKTQGSVFFIRFVTLNLISWNQQDDFFGNGLVFEMIRQVSIRFSPCFYFYNLFGRY